MGIVSMLIFLVIIVKSLVQLSKFSYHFKICLGIIFINALSQYVFTGSFWGSLLLFFALGLINNEQFNSAERTMASNQFLIIK